MNFEGMKAKQVSFNNSNGNDEEQLNRILESQTGTDSGDYFTIYNVVPFTDVRGHDSFWIFYKGKFPDKEVWENKDKK